MEYQSNSNSASTASNGTANTVAATRRTRSSTENPERQQQQPQTAKEVIAANVQSLIEQLEAGHSDALTAYLNAMSRFHNYSFGNILEIARQKPDATRVAGFWKWKEVGRSVKKGEKGIRIIAPIVGIKRKKDTEANKDITKQNTAVLVGFRAAYVFDVSQTEGAELPAMREISGDVGENRDRLLSFIERQGIELVFTERIAPALGMSYGGRIAKSPSFIATRLKLVELLPSIAEAFLADQIGVGHALEIAKLPQDQQQKAFDAAFRMVWNGAIQSRVIFPLRDFTAWIEQNILLSLDSVPFDKADATLVPEAGSCAECPKRTGFNTLLFGEMSHRDQCTDAACLNNKVGRYVARQLEAKPKLVQISTAYGGRVEGSVLPRSRYIALRLAKSKGKQPMSPNEKPCKHMADAIVVEGLERGHTAKVCTEPSCKVHFPGRNNKATNEAQLAREREQRRKELEKRKLESTVRHRILAEVLRKVGAPLDRADLALIVDAILEKMEPLRRETLARRHKMVDGSSSEVTYPQVQKGLQRLVRQLDESGLSKLIVEMVLLGSVESASQDETDALTTTAKRHRVDVVKVRTAVEAEVSAKQAKAAAKQKKAASTQARKPAKAA